MRILITGAGGMLGRALQKRRQDDVVGFTHQQLDISSYDAVSRCIDYEMPDVVINCAAIANVDQAELDEEKAFRVNATGVANLVRACGDIRVVHISTDYVFDGEADEPYAVDAPTNPINAYGRSKLAGELEAIKAISYLVVRTSWVFGAGRTFLRGVMSNNGQPQPIVDDQISRPTYVNDLAHGLIDMLEAPNGIYHLTNDGTASWYDVAVHANPKGNFVRCTGADLNRPARRPRYTPLALSAPARDWRDALADAIHSGAY